MSGEAGTFDLGNAGATRSADVVPQSLATALTPEQREFDMQACRDMIRHGSRTFHAASHLLPKRVREPALALYAFCRQADDLVDLGNQREDAVRWLRRRLECAYAGHPHGAPADRAFAAVISEYEMPRTLPMALIEGMAWDAEGRIYEDLESLFDYCARVAGAVGAMMSVLMGVRDREALARACDLGVAMQLTNICRDVGEDAANGRLYLPRGMMREAGLDPDAWLANPMHGPGLAAVVQELLKVADALYAQSMFGITRLPGSCRPGINAARVLYAEIGRQVERQGLDSVTSRAVVSTGRKLALLPKVLLASAFPVTARNAAPLRANRYLVEAAVPGVGARESMLAGVPWWNIDARIGRIIDLFAQLDSRDRVA